MESNNAKQVNMQEGISHNGSGCTTPNSNRNTSIEETYVTTIASDLRSKVDLVVEVVTDEIDNFKSEETRIIIRDVAFSFDRFAGTASANIHDLVLTPEAAEELAVNLADLINHGVI
jgi:hypothetical protein